MQRLITLGCLLILTQTLLGQATRTTEIPHPANETFGFSMNQAKDQAFYVWSRGGRDTMNIYSVVKKKGKWQKPAPASFSLKPGVWKDIDPFITPDGQQVYFQSNRPVKPNGTASKQFDIWMVSKTPKGWSEAKHLGNIVNSDSSEAFASITREGKLYYGSMRKESYGKLDIFSSVQKDGVWQTPVNAGMTINTTQHDTNPFIAHDESFMILSTDAEGNYGNNDLYISFNINGNWTKPWNLGSSVNSPTSEFCPFMLPGEDTLYFARLEKGKRFKEDLYKVYLPVNTLRQLVTSKASIFEDGLLSTGNTMNTAFEPDGKTVYIARSNSSRSVVKIFQSHFVNGTWSEPEVVPFSQNFAYTGLPYVTADGTKMLFSANGKSKDIWVSDKTPNGWGDPYPLPGNVNTNEHAEYFATMTNKGTLYFSSERGDSKCDIYRAERVNDEWQQPVRVAGISSDASESNPLIAPDESYMIFMADRPDGFGGYDLYISYNENGSWSTPLNLGPEINSDVHDFQPAMSPDGKYFYFTRTPWPTGSDKRYGREDVYRIDARVLPLKGK